MFEASVRFVDLSNGDVAEWRGGSDKSNHFEAYVDLVSRAMKDYPLSCYHFVGVFLANMEAPMSTDEIREPELDETLVSEKETENGCW